MNETQERIKIEGKPYFIKETDEGIFKVITAIERLEDSKYHYYPNINPQLLQLGLDLREVPARELRLYVESKIGQLGISYITACRRLASIASMDYVATERELNGNVGKILSIDSDNKMVKLAIRPRLFVKIVDN